MNAKLPTNGTNGTNGHALPSAEDILNQLTLEEKVALVGAADWWRTEAIRRGDTLLVPHIKTTDGPNGARGESYVSGIKAACFPSSSNTAASFNADLVYEIARATAAEAQTKSSDVLLAPTVCPVRSPLGGRNHETFGEDPYVLGTLGAAYVNGCQSAGIAATPKHFVANEVEHRRRFVSAEIEERALREIYLYPFQLILKKSDPWCWMTSYNRLNGTYCSEHPKLLRDILRREWGFDGLIMSDWVGTYSTADAINAGLDLEIPAPLFFRGPRLLRAINDGEVSLDVLDERVRRVIELVLKTRRMHDPEDHPEYYDADNAARDELIASGAAEGIVLLKNDGPVLPLKKNARVAVIGQHAADPPIMGGGSAVVPIDRIVSPLEGFAAAGVDVTYEPGVPVYGAVPLPLAKVVSQTGSSAAPGQTAKPVRIEWFNGSVIGTNPVKDELVAPTQYMIKEKWPTWLDQDYCARMTLDITPETSGPHTFSVVTTGTARLYVDGKQIYHRPQEPKLQREAFYFFRTKIERLVTVDMVAGRRYTVALESWATPPDIVRGSVGGEVVQGSGIGFVEHVDVAERIKAAAAAAASHDVAVVFTGTTPEFESEGYDRQTMDLLEREYELVRAVAAANPNTVLVNISGSPVTLTHIVDRVAGVVQAFFPGQEAGTSIARVLTGAVNPSGRLPVTWPRRVEDNPAHGNWPGGEDDVIHYREGIYVGYRHYERNQIKPLFPFGFGLSYTTFELSGLEVSAPGVISSDAGVDVSCAVANTGNAAGKVVVQFYVRRLGDDGSSRFDRPVKELKAFAKPSLEAGATSRVAVTLDKYAVSVYDTAAAAWCAEAGTYEVLAGFSSEDIRATARLTVSKEFHWTGL